VCVGTVVVMYMTSTENIVFGLGKRPQNRIQGQCDPDVSLVS